MRRTVVVRLYLSDGLNQMLVDGDEVRLFSVVDHDVRETDKQSLLLVDRVRDAVPHRRNQEISDVRAVDRSDSDPNQLSLLFFSFRHVDLQPSEGRRLAFSTQKLQPSAKLLVLVLSHLFAPLLEHTGHQHSPSGKSV